MRLTVFKVSKSQNRHSTIQQQTFPHGYNIFYNWFCRVSKKISGMPQEKSRAGWYPSPLLPMSFASEAFELGAPLISCTSSRGGKGTGRGTAYRFFWNSLEVRSVKKLEHRPPPATRVSPFVGRVGRALVQLQARALLPRLLSVLDSHQSSVCRSAAERGQGKGGWAVY